MSLTLIEKVGKKASLFRNDMNFVSGLPGFCWCVEWLAQNGFIYNDTNDILIEACAFINKKIKTDLKVLPAGQLLGLVWYYSIRLSNLENSQHTIYKEECEILDNTVKMLKNKGVNDCPKISTNGISLLFKFFYSLFGYGYFLIRITLSQNIANSMEFSVPYFTNSIPRNRKYK